MAKKDDISESNLLKDLLKSTDAVNVQIDNVEIINPYKKDGHSQEARAFRSKIKEDILYKLDHEFHKWDTASLARYIQETYGYKRRQSYTYIRQAEAIIDARAQKSADNIVRRFDRIAKKAEAEGRYSDAIKANEQIGKLAGRYTEKVEVKGEPTFTITLKRPLEIDE